MHGCILSTVATDALVVNHQAITIYSAFQIYIALDQFCLRYIRFIINNTKKALFWNSTQIILPIHWKIWFLYHFEFFYPSPHLAISIKSFQSNSIFHENWYCHGFEKNDLIVVKSCICEHNIAVLACAKYNFDLTDGIKRINKCILI